MTKKILIHFCNGSGGQFLMSVFARMMGIQINTKISPQGHCHDHGFGIWKVPSNKICFDCFDTKSNTMKLHYHPEAELYATHSLTTEFIEQHPDIILIQIAAKPSDYYSITKLVVKKAWPSFWTQEEYNKWKSPHYPPYSTDNIANSDLICNDLINVLLTTQTTVWYEQHAFIKYAHVIDFSTVMGVDNKTLVQIVADITGGQLTDEVCKFVDEYQQLNKKILFN
jgi:hypothetical protein